MNNLGFMSNKPNNKWISTIIFSIILFAVLFFPRIDHIERWSIDQRFFWRLFSEGPRSPSRDIVIVRVDQETIDWHKFPSFGRNFIYEEFVKAMQIASPSCVFLDFVFDNSPDEEIQNLVKKILDQNNINVPYEIIRKISFDKSFRNALMDVTRKGLNLILGFLWQPGQPPLIEKTFLRSLLNRPTGFLNLDSDDVGYDNVIRSCSLFSLESNTGKLSPSVALLAAAYSANTSYQLASNNELLFNGEAIPNLQKGRQGFIDYAGPQGTFASESFKNVLIDAETHPERLSRFAAKTVLVGRVDIISDVKRVPFGFMPGVEVHANIVDNILNKHFMRTFTTSFTAGILFAILIIQVVSFTYGTRTGSALTLIIALGWTVICFCAFHYGYVLPLIKPLVFAVVSGLIEGLRIYKMLENERQKIRELFGRYVNDSIINALLEKPQEEILKGNRRVICVMFTDIRDFTSFAEQRDPKDVVAFLNKYFEGATRIIQKHNGAVDKFLGDGLMAFFNAPLESDFFIRDAVAAALEIKSFLQQKEIREATNSFELKIGIALHAGPALVGNIGSERKMEFTAIGDTVNTTSRMEGLNKELGTDIIACDVVADSTKSEFIWKSLGEFALRGKEKPVVLYSLIGPVNDNTKPSEKGD